MVGGKPGKHEETPALCSLNHTQALVAARHIFGTWARLSRFSHRGLIRSSIWKVPVFSF